MTKTAETAMANVERAIAYRFPPNWWAIYPVRATAALPESAGISRSTNKDDPRSLVNSQVTAGTNWRHVHIAPRHVLAARVVVKLVAKDAITIRREQMKKQAKRLRSAPQSQWRVAYQRVESWCFRESCVSESSFSHSVSWADNLQQIIRNRSWRKFARTAEYTHPVLAHSSLCLRLMGTEY